jgi:carboxylesterase
VVAGQSMGGTLALHLAARDPRVRAVATLAAPIWLPGPLPPLLPILTRVVRWHHTGSDIDLWHPDAVEELYSYGIRPTRSINELRRVCAVVRNELAEVRAPVFVLHGERDRTIDPRCATEIAQRLINSEAVQLRMLPRSGHAISVDVDREVVNADILQWFERFAPAEATAAAGAATATH